MSVTKNIKKNKKLKKLIVILKLNTLKRKRGRDGN